MTAIKFCGVTRLEDAALAVELGVHAVGFVFWPKSPRCVSFADAAAIVHQLPPIVAPVGVFVDPTRDELERAASVGIAAFQIHGAHVDWSRLQDMSPRMIRAVHLSDEDEGIAPVVDASATVLLDAHDPVRVGGSGQAIDWTRAALVAAKRRVILAGGLTPSNVADAIRTVRPYGVDVASGVEERPGIKDPMKMRAFVAAVSTASHECAWGPPLGGPGPAEAGPHVL